MQKTPFGQQVSRILPSLGLSIIAGVIAAFVINIFLATFGFFNGSVSESAIQSVIFGWAFVTAILYAVFSVRSFRYSIWGAMLRLGRNILVALIAGFLFTIVTSASYSNILFFDNMSFLMNHILPLWFFVALVVVSVFSLDYARRQRSALPPRTAFVKPVSS